MKHERNCLVNWYSVILINIKDMHYSSSCTVKWYSTVLSIWMLTLDVPENKMTELPGTRTPDSSRASSHLASSDNALSILAPYTLKKKKKGAWVTEYLNSVENRNTRTRIEIMAQKYRSLNSASRRYQIWETNIHTHAHTVSCKHPSLIYIRISNISSIETATDARRI